MYRQDRDSIGNGGGFIVYIKDSVPFHICDIFGDVDDIVWAHELQLVTSVIDSHAPLKER